MANLIIKSSANDLVIQGSDESPAITVAAAGTTTFAENATLSGTANNLGTVATGVIGSNVTGGNIFNRDNSFFYQMGATASLSNATINYSTVPSGVTNGTAHSNSSGVITITNAGYYLFSYTMGKGNSGTVAEAWFDYDAGGSGTFVQMGGMSTIGHGSGSYYETNSNSGCWLITAGSIIKIRCTGYISSGYSNVCVIRLGD
jgi:hypothetical protein